MPRYQHQPERPFLTKKSKNFRPIMLFLWFGVNKAICNKWSILDFGLQLLHAVSGPVLFWHWKSLNDSGLFYFDSICSGWQRVSPRPVGGHAQLLDRQDRRGCWSRGDFDKSQNLSKIQNKDFLTQGWTGQGKAMISLGSDKFRQIHQKSYPQIQKSLQTHVIMIKVAPYRD